MVNNFPSVAVIGMGYVGLTLSAVLAGRGYTVHGVETNPQVVSSLVKKEMHLLEPGVEEVVKKCIGHNWQVSEKMPVSPDVVILCVSTPLGKDGKVNLANLEAATRSLLSVITDKTLVIVRSTVPIGTTRNIVYPLLHQKIPQVKLAFCPERTIQGQALKELVELPQVIGALDRESLKAAQQFFGGFVKQMSIVSSLEAAEMVKLINNCHTDLIYSFGNEVALMASEFHLDPLEVLRAANQDYPRPDLCKPGFVGGACLSKDPYILMQSFSNGHLPRLVEGARQLNESLPTWVAHHFVDVIRSAGIDVATATILVCGFAYKGVPATDDMRGSPVFPFLASIKPHVGKVLGHDFIVTPHVIRENDVTPVSLEEGMAVADGIIFLNNHPAYRALQLDKLLVHRTGTPPVIYDCWRIFQLLEPQLRQQNVTYAGIGYAA